MTKEEAIKELQESHDMMRNYAIDENESRLMTALNMAIKALRQEPKTDGDTISRVEVFEQINCWIVSGEYCYKNATHYLWKRIKELQSVTPQPICEEREKGECPYYAG